MTGGLSKNFHGVGIGPLSKKLAVKLGKIPLSSDQGQSYVVYWVKNKINNFRFLSSVWKPYSSSAYRLGISPYCFARHVTKNDPDFYYGRTLCY